MSTKASNQRDGTGHPVIINSENSNIHSHVLSHSGTIVVMVGDQQNPGGSGSTGSIEVYWQSNNSFTEGPPLPREINEAAVVQADGSFLLVGGVTCCPEESADILRFDYYGWKWEVSTLCGIISVVMFSFLFFLKFRLPIGLHSSRCISQTASGKFQIYITKNHA